MIDYRIQIFNILKYVSKQRIKYQSHPKSLKIDRLDVNMDYHNPVDQIQPIVYNFLKYLLITKYQNFKNSRI